MPIAQGEWPLDKLELVQHAISQERHWQLGDRVRLVSGGPVCLVVEVSGQAEDVVTISWRDIEGATCEWDINAICLVSAFSSLANKPKWC